MDSDQLYPKDLSTKFKRAAKKGLCKELRHFKCNLEIISPEKTRFASKKLTVTMAKWHAWTWYSLSDEQALKLTINLKWSSGMLSLNVEGWCHCHAYTQVWQLGNDYINSSRGYRTESIPFHCCILGRILLWTLWGSSSVSPILLT